MKIMKPAGISYSKSGNGSHDTGAMASVGGPPSYSCLNITRHPDCPHVVIVSLCRPSKKNAINSTMWKEIGHCFRTIHLAGDVRAIVLQGEGPCFSTGLCLSDPTLMPFSNNPTKKSSSKPSASYATKQDPARIGLAFLSKVQEMQSCFTAVEECPVPVIASIHSHCVGAGIDLITACDIRLCSDDAKFSVREVVVGLAADVGTLQRFPKVVGHDSRVRELCLTGEMFDSKEAHRIGLVSRVIEPTNGGESRSTAVLHHALEVAKKIAMNSPIAVTGTKRSLVYSRDHSVRDGLDHIATHNALALQTHDLPTAFVSARRKQRPQFDNMYPASKL